MGVGKMESIVDQIRKGGKSPETPAAIVERGTYAHQRVVEGNLKDILSRARKAGVKPPAVIVVGEVTQLRNTIAWFESLPLAGKTVVVTRAREQAGPFIDSLEQAGARAIPFPTIEIALPKGLKAVDEALGRIKEYNYIVFTSVNGVTAFLSHMHRLQKDIRCLDGCAIAALGEMTAQALRKHLLFPKIVPTTFTSRHLARQFKREALTGKKVLLFRSEIANDILPGQLRRMGAQVTEVSGYTIRKPRVPTAKVKQHFRNGDIDLITFTSPSTFTNFVSLMGGEPVKQLLQGTRVAAIGPVTKKEIVQHGVRVAVTAAPHTVPHLVEEIIAYYRSKKR
jgi:uroporphyrinogen III methyltransferase/synthase